jgi:hypothetical protein
MRVRVNKDEYSVDSVKLLDMEGILRLFPVEQVLQVSHEPVVLEKSVLSKICDKSRKRDDCVLGKHAHEVRGDSQNT